MGFVLRLLGRLLFIAVFVGSGIKKVQDPTDNAKYLSASYTTFHKWVQTTDAFKKSVELIPHQVVEHIPLIKQYTSPQFVQTHSHQIITYVGYTLIACSALVLLGFRLGGWILYLFTLMTIAIIHNPFANPKNFDKEFMAAVINLAIAGIALFIAADIRPECGKQAPAKGKVEEKKKPSSASVSKEPSRNDKKKKN